MKIKFLFFVCSVLLLATDAAANERIIKDFNVGSEPRLVMEVGPARVMIEMGADSVITVDAELPDGNLYSITATQDQDKIHVRLEPKGTLGWVLQPVAYFTEEVLITVKVPPATSIVLDTWGSRMEIRGITGEIRARSGSEVTRLIRSFFKIS